MRRTIDLFFVMYPTPSALLRADIKDVQELLDPVGLQETRRQAYHLHLPVPAKSLPCIVHALLGRSSSLIVQEGCPGHDAQLLCTGGLLALIWVPNT